MAQPFYYGGQAVIEGVMMRGRKNIAIAVRDQNGDLSVHKEQLNPFYNGALRRIPFARGVVVLAESLFVGMKALFYSASTYVGEEAKLNPLMIWGTVIAGLAFALGLFLALPLVAIHFVDPYVNSVVSNTVEGAIRLALFIAYLKVITLMPDIRRVFAYHGAEHKTINAYEAGRPLNVEAVRQYGTAHTRCGTSFLLVVMVIALIAFIFLGRPPMWIRLASRIVFLPLIAGVSYEIIRLGAGHARNKVMRVLLWPGMALQSMTTREPDDQQIEVAISALNGVFAADAQLAVEAAPVPSVASGAGSVDFQ